MRPFGRRPALLLPACLLALIGLVRLDAGPRSQAWAGEGRPTPFESPEQAGRAVAAACERGDRAALLAIFGADAQDLLDAGDAAAAAAAAERFAALARQALAVEPAADGRSSVLLIGHAAWPFPVPLVREEAGWRFDAGAARVEILARRIGANELSAIELCRAYGPAQRAYAAEDRDGDGCLEFAARLRSSEGARDGLWWPTAAGEAPSPFGPLVAAAGQDVQGHRPGDPWKGYHFRVLTRQGEHAPGGAYDYRGPKGDLLGGCALIAWPAAWRKSGVMTFLVGREGRVLQQDLGEATAEAVARIEAFDPGPGWTPVGAP